MGQAHEGISQVPKTIIFTVTPVTVFQVQGMINSKPVLFMVDTGAAVSLISLNCWHEIGESENELDKHRNPMLMGVDGSTLQMAETIKLQVHLEGRVFVMSVVVIESLQTAAIMGMDFLEINQGVMDAGSKSLWIKGLKQPIPLYQPSSTSTVPNHMWAVLSRTIQIPGNSELEVMAKLESASHAVTLYLEGRALPKQPSVLVTAAVVSGESQEIPVRMVNWAPDTTKVQE